MNNSRRDNNKANKKKAKEVPNASEEVTNDDKGTNDKVLSPTASVSLLPPHGNEEVDDP